ncbi:arginine--tRNA ligase, partial [Candidatus Parcubacteria bacterium]
SDLKESEVRKEPIETLAKLYLRFHKELETDPRLEEEGRAEFRKLEEGDKENRRLWEWFRRESIKELKKLYKLLGVWFTTYIGESFFEKEMKPLVSDLLRKGVAKESEGSVIVSLEEENLPPALIQKSDGASLYLTRDIANLRYRISKFKPAKMLYVVGNEQTLHFAQLFAIAKILGFPKLHLAHVKYGLLLGEDARKLSTRKGGAVLAKEVIGKAMKLAKSVVAKKNPGLPRKTKDRVAEDVGIGALKYNILRENHHSDIVFDWAKMLDIFGETGPYLQYTYARLRSIRRKARGGGKPDVSLLAKEEELALIRKFFEFPEELKRSEETYLTNNLTIYLYELASLANKFYETTPVLKEKNAGLRAARLLLVEVVARTIKQGLALLGIGAPERI